MATKTTTNSKFVQQVISRSQESDIQKVAERNESKAKAAINQQIQALASSRVDAEIELEEAQEAMIAALYPTSPITNGNSYMQGIKKAKDALQSKEEALQNIEESSKYFQSLLEEKF